MAIKIDKDGTIITNNEGQPNQAGSTNVHDAGAIGARIGSSTPNNQRRYTVSPPVSPLENRNTEIREVPAGEMSQPNPPTSAKRKSISELEYDLMVKNGQIKGATPKKAITVACVFAVIALLFQSIYLAIPAGIALIFVAIGFSKKSAYSKEKQEIQNEIDGYSTNKTSDAKGRQEIQNEDDGVWEKAIFARDLFVYGKNKAFEHAEDESHRLFEQNPERYYRIMFDMYTRKANENDAFSQYMLGNMHMSYDNYKDLEKSLNWYFKAADNGYNDAISDIEHIAAKYDLGIDMPENKAKAYELYMKCANLGSAASQYEIGMYYANGTIVEKDKEKAIKWLTMSADQGNAKGQRELGHKYMWPDSPVHDDEKSFYWFNKAAEQGDGISQSWVASYYEKGKGVEKNIEKAIYWYEQAAKDDNQYALESAKRLRSELHT